MVFQRGAVFMSQNKDSKQFHLPHKIADGCHLLMQFRILGDMALKNRNRLPGEPG